MLNNLLKQTDKIKLINEHRIINLHELPIAKKKFKATVSKISFDNNTDAGKQNQYLYLKNLKIKIDNIWFNVESSGNAIRVKMGKKLKKMFLKEDDVLTFEAHVVSRDVEFDQIEGYHDISFNKLHCEPHAVLPQSYNGNITVYMYNDIFSKHYCCWHNNYVEYFDRKTFDMKYESFFEFHTSEDGNFKRLLEPRSMFFESRELKHLSNIIALKTKTEVRHNA